MRKRVEHARATFLLAQKVAKNALKGEGFALSLNNPSPEYDTTPLPPEYDDTLYPTNLSSDRVSFWGKNIRLSHCRRRHRTVPA